MYAFRQNMNFVFDEGLGDYDEPPFLLSSEERATHRHFD